MTTTTDTAPQNTRALIVEREQRLAVDMADGLHRMANMIADRPGLAPLLRVMLSGLINSVSGEPDPELALTALTQMAAAHDATYSPATYGGYDIWFSPAVRMLVVTSAPVEPVAAVQVVPQSAEPEDIVAEADPDAETQPAVAA